MKLHILQTGTVHITKYLAFGGQHCSLLKVGGIGAPQKDWIWLPVFCFLLEHPKGKVLIDTGWSRDMSPEGVFDKKAQIESLGSRLLYHINQGVLPQGEAIDEQLSRLGIATKDLDYVVLSHLDCDHANGLHQVADAKKILVSETEMVSDTKFTPENAVRFHKKWWENVQLTLFGWNGNEGPYRRSFDLFGDGSVQLINIPGHTEGLCAVKLQMPKGNLSSSMPTAVMPLNHGKR